MIEFKGDCIISFLVGKGIQLSEWKHFQPFLSLWLSEVGIVQIHSCFRHPNVSCHTLIVSLILVLASADHSYSCARSKCVNQDIVTEERENKSHLASQKKGI